MWQDLSYGKLTQDLAGVYEVTCDEGGTESPEDYIFRCSLRSRKMNALCGDHVQPSTLDIFVKFL